MSATAKLFVEYRVKNNTTYSAYFPVSETLIPEETIKFEAPTDDLTSTQVIAFLSKIMLTMGFSEHNIHRGMMSVLFNPDNSHAEMRSLCEEYDLVMNEDLQEKLEEMKKQDEEYEKQIKENQQTAKTKCNKEYDIFNLCKEVLEEI